MTDKLKQFIDDNRAAFDSEEPGEHLFHKMKNEKNSIPRIQKWKPMKWVAIIAGLLLLSASLYWVMGRKETKDDIVVTEEKKIEEVTGINDPVYARQIYQFKELIGLQQEELKQLQKDYPELYKQFVNDMNELDSAYQSLKVSLPENPNREMLLEAMIQNLQLQSDLLNRQLLIIKEIKQKNRSHEKNNI